MSCNNVDTNDCGCSHTHDSKCIIYTGQNLSCISVVSGDDLTTVLENINETICSLTPSGVPTVVVQEGSGIDVTSSTVGDITTYTIALSAATITALTNIGISLSTINACLASTVRDIVSDTLAISVDSSNGCGRVLRIESIAPSSVPLEAGIIYNNTDTSATNGGGGTQILKSFNTDYTQYSITTGDEISFVATGQLIDNSNVVDDIIIDLFDATGATVLATNTFTGWNNDGKSSYIIEGTITVTGVSTALYNLSITYHSLANGVLNSTRNGYLINKDVTGVDYTNLTIRVKYQNTSGASTDNFAKQLKVEVKKLI